MGFHKMLKQEYAQKDMPAAPLLNQPLANLIQAPKMNLFRPMHFGRHQQSPLCHTLCGTESAPRVAPISCATPVTQSSNNTATTSRTSRTFMVQSTLCPLFPANNSFLNFFSPL